MEGVLNPTFTQVNIIMSVITNYYNLNVTRVAPIHFDPLQPKSHVHGYCSYTTMTKTIELGLKQFQLSWRTWMLYVYSTLQTKSVESVQVA